VATGQVRLLFARQPINEVLADPDTPDRVRERLLLAERVRRFAASLGLELGKQYTSYAAWPGDRIVTTVVATQPGHIEPHPFRFPIVGSVPYKGFFDSQRAEAEAARLRARGFDVCLFAVPAYSTLGWFADPLTQPMLRRSEGELVETIVHELVHATAFTRDQPEFNEGVAQFIGEEASVAFFADDPIRARRQRHRVTRDRRWAGELLAFRRSVEALYQSVSDPERRRVERAALESELRERLALHLVDQTSARDALTRLRLNDACLALRGTYAGDSDRHVRVLDELGGNLNRFVARLRTAMQSDDPRAAFFGELP